MPTASGQYQLQDYIAELQVRGFDTFTPADLTTLTNRGYYHVARHSRWLWEQTTDPFTITPGQYSVDVTWGSVEMPGFRSMQKLVGTTAGFETVLKPMKDEDFYKWLGQDNTSTGVRSEPIGYYIFQQHVYILPPPQATRAFLAYYFRRPVPLVNPTDVPMTPQHLDEAILLATLVRCHKRSNEPTLAALMEADLEEFFDDMRDDESNESAEKIDRVRPDNTWL